MEKIEEYGNFSTEFLTQIDKKHLYQIEGESDDEEQSDAIDNDDNSLLVFGVLGLLAAGVGVYAYYRSKKWKLTYYLKDDELYMKF